MSNSDFLKKMLEEGEKHSSKPVYKTIGRINISFAYNCFVKDRGRTDFLKLFKDNSDAKRVAAEVTARAIEAGGKMEAVLGFYYRIPKEYLLGFEAEYDKTRFVSRFGEEEDFMAIYDAINELDLPLNEDFWCACKSIESLSAVAKGEDGKYTNQKGKDVYPTFLVPVEKFINEQAAREVVGGSGLVSTSNVNSKWSETAIKAYPEGNLPEEEILKWFEAAKEGIPFNNNAENFSLPVPSNELTCKKYIAEIYSIETVDIDQMIPF